MRSGWIWFKATQNSRLPWFPHCSRSAKQLGTKLLFNELGVSAGRGFAGNKSEGWLLARYFEMHESLPAGGDGIAGVAGLVRLGHAIAAEHGLRDSIGTPWPARITSGFDGVAEIQHGK